MYVDENNIKYSFKTLILFNFELQETKHTNYKGNFISQRIRNLRNLYITLYFFFLDPKRKKLQIFIRFLRHHDNFKDFYS